MPVVPTIDLSSKALASHLNHLKGFTKIPLSRSHPRQIKSESLSMWPQHQYFFNSPSGYNVQSRLRTATPEVSNQCLSLEGKSERCSPKFNCAHESHPWSF